MMQAFTKHRGLVAVLNRINVDTDQIIPKQFLKRIERTGYGPFLFYDWRQDPAFVLNRPEHAGAAVLVAGANFGAVCRAVIAPSFGDIFHANSFKTGILSITLPDRQVRHLIDLASEDPEAVVEVDLEKQEDRGEGFTYKFEVDPFVRECLLKGLDEIGLVERHQPAIADYESRRMEWL